jgi:DNA-binding CsgD family transcriptional regulator
VVGSAVAELDRVADLCARLDLAVCEDELAERVVEPIAGLVRAETASLRCFGLVNGAPAPLTIVSIGIPGAVREAYLGRYFELDPVRRLVARRLSRPLFAEPVRYGQWPGERSAPESVVTNREEFSRYRREFLLPNRFYHHLGFYVQDSAGRMLAFDFHRPEGSLPFKAIEQARARVVAEYLNAEAGAKRLPRPPSAAGRAHDGALSHREAQVADAVATGLSNKQVAESLGISVRTVENHLRSIFAKYGVTTRTRLAAKLRQAYGSLQ